MGGASSLTHHNTLTAANSDDEDFGLYVHMSNFRWAGGRHASKALARRLVFLALHALVTKASAVSRIEIKLRKFAISSSYGYNERGLISNFCA